ncbi:MAG: hypothetical protein ACQ9MH_05295 [Nitrospinales bacterium]
MRFYFASERRIFFWAIIIALVSSTTSYAQDANNTILQLDKKYFYPQHNGLKKLSVQIIPIQQDTVYDAERFFQLPGINFHWKKNPSGSERSFSIADVNEGTLVDRGQETLQFVKNFSEMVIPKTLQERFTDYQGKRKKTLEGRIFLSFESLNPNQNILRYDLLIDPKGLKIDKMIIHQKSGPRQVKVKLTYNKLKKFEKWQLAASVANFELDGKPYQEITQYFYNQVEKLSLAKKVEQTLKKDGKIIQSYTFNIVDPQIN